MTRWLSRSEAAWLAGIIVLSGAGLVLGVRHGFFYADDVVNLSQAHTQGLTADLLTSDYFGHLAPGHRVLDWLTAGARGSWAVAVGLLLAFWLVAVGAFYAVARQLAGRGFLALATTAMLASSVVYVRTVSWPASGDHIVPSMAFTLVGLAAALRLHATRSAGALAWAFGAALVGLLFYEKPVLLLVYVAGILCFVRAPSLRPRALAGLVRAEAPLLGGLLLIAVVYLIALKVFDYAPAPQHASLSDWETYLRATWMRGTTPLLIDQAAPEGAPQLSSTLRWGAEAVLAVLVAWSIARRLQAWRAWAFYAAVWALNVGIVGYARVGPFGPLIGLDPRYVAEFAYLLPLALVLAFGPGPGRGLGVVRRAERRLRARPAIGWAAVGAIVALWVASSANAYDRVGDWWPGHDSGVVTHRMLRGVDALHAPVTLIDAPLDFAVAAGDQARVSDWVRVFRPDVRFDGPEGLLYVVEPHGTVRSARDVRVAYRRPLRFSGACFPPEGSFVLAPPTQLQGAAFLLDVVLTRATPVRVDVYVDHLGKGYPATPDRRATVHPGDRRLRVDLGAGPVAKVLLAVKQAPLCASVASLVSFG